MDDFRKRYDVPRRDYGMPGQAQPPTPPEPARQIPINSEPAQQFAPPAVPAYQPPALSPAQSEPPDYIQEPQPQFIQTPAPAEPQHQSLPPAPQPQYQPLPNPDLDYHRPTVPNPAEAAAQTKPKSKLSLKTAGIAAAIAVLLIGGAFFALKPKKTAAVMPSDLAKKANFSVYYPSSLPAGYVYSAGLATFDNGGAYYTFTKGPKHIIIRENLTSTGKLDTNEVTDPQPLDMPVGKAVIGTNTGQTAAAVLADKTYIFIYSNNSVPKEEITAIVQNLKNISQNK